MPCMKRTAFIPARAAYAAVAHATLPDETTATVSNPSARAWLMPTETCRSLNDPVGLPVSFFRRTRPKPLDADRRVASSNGFAPSFNVMTLSGESSGSRSKYVHMEEGAK